MLAAAYARETEEVRVELAGLRALLLNLRLQAHHLRAQTADLSLEPQAQGMAFLLQRRALCRGLIPCGPKLDFQRKAFCFSRLDLPLERGQGGQQGPRG